MTNIPTKHKEWLNARGISDEVLFKNNVSVNNAGSIVIPVYDPNGVFLFNKYRRNPFNDEGSKYRYDRGATTALYNAHAAFFPSDPVFICEGELDAMAIQSKGHYAVSTTGGSGSFDPAWAELLKGRNQYICYDNDLAGMQGTLRVLAILPTARVILIPRKHEVKDITEFILKNESGFVSLVNTAVMWYLPTTKQECIQTAKVFEERRQEMLRTGIDNDFPVAALAAVTAVYDSLKAKERKKNRTEIKDGDAIMRAKQVPISEYIQFNRKGDALCINHTDKHPSMHYFKKNNKVKCFACGFSEDTIGVVQKLFNLSVGEAIKKINA